MDFSETSSMKLMLKMCVPSVLVVLVMQLYHLADTFFIGKLDDIAMMSGLSMAGPAILVFTFIGVLIGGGGCSFLAMTIGKGDEASCDSIVSFCFWSTLVLGLAVSLGMILLVDDISKLLGCSAESAVYCKEYLLTISIGAPFMSLATSLGSLVRGNGNAIQSMKGNILGSTLNMVLDPLFIFVLKLNVKGVAIATVLSNLIAVIYYIVFMESAHFGRSLRIRDFTIRKDISLNVISLGVPVASSTVLTLVASVLSNKVLANYGDIMVSSVNITRKIISFVSMFQIGITSGMQPVLAYHFGGGRLSDLKAYTRRTGLATVIVGTAMTIISMLLGPVLIKAFMDDTDVVRFGVKSMRIMLMCGPIAGLQQLATVFFQATKKPMTALALSFTKDGLIMLPLLYLMNNLWGFDGYLLSRPASTFLASLLGVSMILMYVPGLSKGRTST